MQMRFNVEMKTLGDRVKHYRELRGLSQKDLGVSVGLDQTVISKLERGLMQETTKVAEIAHELKIDAYWLATNKGKAEQVNSHTSEGELAAQVIDGIFSESERQRALKIVNSFAQPADGTNGTQ